MAGKRDMSRIMRQMLHKKQERTQTIQSEEPRINDLKEGIPEFRNVKDRGVVQYVKYRDEIYSIVMEKEGLGDGIDEGASDIIGNVDRSWAGDTEQSGSGTSHGVCSNATYKTEWSCTDAGETWTDTHIGWATLTDGLIIQWGIVTSDSTVTFPKAFNGACFGVFFGKIDTDASIPRVTAITNTTFDYSTSTVADGNAYWLALGH